MTNATAVGVGAGAALAVAAGRVWQRYLAAGDQVRRFAAATHDRIDALGAVDSLEVLPLVERERIGDDHLRTEVGVSYLLRTTTGSSSSTILFDFGLNRDGEADSALLTNADRLGVDLSGIDAAVVSHVHDDHVGGPRARRRRRPVMAGGAPVEPRGAPLHVPVAMGHDLLDPVVTTGPTVVARGVALLPPAPATLFWEGVVHEQALVVDVRDVGLVLVTGCGHPGVDVVLALASSVLDRPVHAVVGGLHLPVGGYPAIRLLGSPRPPWDPLDGRDVAAAAHALDAAHVRRVVVSPHDSTPWAVARLGAADGADGADVAVCRVGEAVRFGR